MKFRKLILLSLLILSSVFVANGQKTQVSPTPQFTDDDDISCALITELLVVDVSVLNAKNLFVENLTNYDFEVYYKKEKQEISYFIFDTLKNQYRIGFYPDDDYPKKIKSDDIEVRLKLSKEKKNQYGKVFIIRK